MAAETRDTLPDSTIAVVTQTPRTARRLPLTSRPGALPGKPCR